MKRYFIFLTALAMLLAACKGTKQATKAKSMFETKFIAQTPDLLRVPESVYYYAPQDILFVSNVNGMPLAKDGNGFISKISKDGKILQLKWITGLNAPKGMGVYKGKLYVTDIDRIAVIDIAKAKIDTFINVKGAKFLNDIAIDSSGTVYISDSNNDLVYKYDGKNVTILATGLKGANGLYIQNGKLLVGCNDRLASVNMQTGKVQTIMKVDCGMIDGLQPFKNGYIISNWKDKVFFMNPANKTLTMLFYFPEKNKNAADLCYVAKYHLLYIPTFFGNRVLIYQFK